METYSFDVIVVGGGHAGIEAAWAAANMGSKTALVSLELDKIGTMPCNPAIGGIGKGHLVFELSAMGGLMPKLCSTTYLQARMLNTRKGPAVQGLRLQIDKHAYSKRSQEMLKAAPNLTLIGGRVDTITTDNNRITGLILADGTHLSAHSIVITTGTFLNGTIHIGQQQYEGGRRGEKGVKTLSEFFKQHNIQLGRLKTGTPPRLLTASLDFTAMEEQAPDNLAYLFEFYPRPVISTHPCHITHTNEQTHTIIRENLGLSAMYSGNIKGIGPRYCPSIEDKISRFAQKNSHHIFVEPEDATGLEVYPNGLSTSLPAHVQEQYIRSIKGFEHAIITKLGYAIEYDFVNPCQLQLTLELKAISGLFLAGQINGTTGYEEAAAQGLVAGINAHQKAHGKDPVIFERHESYIGVMIDDLVHMGIDEPYRMFTSRAERRLLLRQDNAFERLMPKAYALGLIDEQLWADFCAERVAIQETLRNLKAAYNQAQLQKLFEQEDTDFYEIVHKHAPTELSQRAAVTVQAECLYEPYLKREAFEVERRQQYKTMRIPAEFPIKDLPGLSKELQEKIIRHTPSTIADAALIPGMTPAALSLLIFKVKEYTKNGLGRTMRTTLLLLVTLLGISTASADTRTVTLDNDFANFFDLDRSFAPYKSMVEGLPITVKSGGLFGWFGHRYTTCTPHEQFTVEVVDNKLELTIFNMPLEALFAILPKAQAMLAELLAPHLDNPGYYAAFKNWLINKLKERLHTINITLYTTIDPDEELVHFTEIVINFIEMEQNDQLGFSIAPLKKALVLYDKNNP
jgi:tRNA uridine 5-carboxymethylaminomethyl modification enzyme